MTDNSKKVSQLPQAANASSTDRIVILKSPSTNASVRTISLTNFEGSLSKASPDHYGIVKIGYNISIDGNGAITSTAGVPANGASVGYVLSTDSTGNVVWQPYTGVVGVLTSNTPSVNTYVATSNDNVMFFDPANIGSDVLVTLPIGEALIGKTYTIKNINPGGGGYKVVVTTDNIGSSFIEDPVKGSNTYVVRYNISNKGQTETWVFDGVRYRHLNTDTPIPVFYTNSNTSQQVIIKNANTGSSAYASLKIYNDYSNELENTGSVLDIGINSNNYAYTPYAVTSANDSRIFSYGGRLIMGAANVKDIVFVAGGTTLSDKKLTINSSSISANVNISPIVNNFLSIGNTSNYWAAVYANNAFFKTLSFNTLTSGSNSVNIIANTYTWTFSNTGTTTTPGSIIPNDNSSYTLGNNTLRWSSIYLGSPTNSLVFPDNTTQNTAFNSTTAVTNIVVGAGLRQANNTGNVTIESTGPLTIAGTIKQVNIANVGGNYTLSLPQNISTDATVQFGSLTVGDFTVTGTYNNPTAATVSDKFLRLAYDSSSSSQIDGGGITLGNISSAYDVSILYNLSTNSWDTGSTDFRASTLWAHALNTDTLHSDRLRNGTGYTGYEFTNSTLQTDDNVAGFSQSVMKNHSSSIDASTDYVATNDLGDNGSYYIDFGINSSTYANSDFSMGGPNDGYLYVANGGLDIATKTAGKDIQFFTGNTTSNALRATINTTGLAVVGNVSASYFTGNLIGNVNGTANVANYVIANSGIISNAYGVFIDPEYFYANFIPNLSGYLTLAGTAANVITLTSNNVTYVGSVAAANVVSNSQLQANLANYALNSALGVYFPISSLASNVFSLTANNVTYVGDVPVANVVSNAQLQANLSNYFPSASLPATLAGYQVIANMPTSVGALTANNTNFVGNVAAVNMVSIAQLAGNLAFYQTTSGMSSTVASLTSNNTNFVGNVAAANVVSNTQLSSNLANYVTTSSLVSNLANYIGVSTQVTFTNTITFSNTVYHNNGLVIGALTASASNGTAGQVLTSSGTGTYWSNNIPQTSVYILNSDRTLLNQSTVQSAFGVGINLASATRYKYRFVGAVYKAGATGTYALQYSIGGNAVYGLHSIMVTPCWGASQETPTATLPMTARRTSNFGTAITITGTSTGLTWYSFVIEGIVDVTTGGTFYPQIGFTGTPGVGSLIQQGSVIEIWPLGATGSNTNIGGWAT